MRSTSQVFKLSLAAALAGSLALPTRQAAVQAADLDQLLQAAAEEAKGGSDGEKSDKSDKSDKDAKAETKSKEENGAKKDEDTEAKAAKKPASEAAEKPKSKYPPYAELLKDT